MKQVSETGWLDQGQIDWEGEEPEQKSSAWAVLEKYFSDSRLAGFAHRTDGGTAGFVSCDATGGCHVAHLTVRVPPCAFGSPQANSIFFEPRTRDMPSRCILPINVVRGIPSMVPAPSGPPTTQLAASKA
jgi:hypothetical protein